MSSNARDPIAIIGIGCRFAGGVNSPRQLWELVLGKGDAIQEVPSDHWSLEAFYDADRNKPGKTYTKWGGFLRDLDQMDASFFGISPREASRVDPAQRLLLEVAWEALEDGGVVPGALAGSDTGVFVGTYLQDYHRIQLGAFEHENLNIFSALGTAMSLTANRISYILDLRGPSVALDTACSSSLVAVHMACQSIWSGETSLALAGGANIALLPEMTIAMGKAGMMAADGHCKAFDARGDGFVRAEGVGVLILKPLSQALADGDLIYASILATVTNQDGHTKGITVPNEESQAAAMRRAVERAGIQPHQIQYIEAHGTGTPVGDPIEARALGAALGGGREKGRECVLGSVKTNIGHTEAASGIAGLSKVAMALRHGIMPPLNLFTEPNPKVDFAALGLRIPTKTEPWPENIDGAPRLCGVNSFGFGGTNAHAILREAPRRSTGEPFDVSAQEAADDRPRLLPLSARSKEALTALASSYIEFLADSDSQEGSDGASSDADTKLNEASSDADAKLNEASSDADTKLNEASSDADTKLNEASIGAAPDREAVSSHSDAEHLARERMQVGKPLAGALGMEDRVLGRRQPGRRPEAFLRPTIDFSLDIARHNTLANICHSAALRREHHDHRLAVVAGSKQEAIEHLQAFVAGDSRMQLVSGRLPGDLPGSLVFVFPGMGHQWWGMGRELLESEPVFRESMEECDALLRPYVSWSLLDELKEDESRSRADEADVGQILVFALQVALARLWRSRGIEPSAVVGHSVGEVAAAFVAGALSLADALRVIYHRAQVQAKAVGWGGMLAVGQPANELAPLLERFGGDLSVSVQNSPRSVVISGKHAHLEELHQELESQAIFNRFVKVEFPAHHALLDPLVPELMEALHGIEPRPSEIPLYSAVKGGLLEGVLVGPKYWGENLRLPVHFAAVMQGMLDAGHRLFVELSAHPVLCTPMTECVADWGYSEALAVPSLRRKEPERAHLLAAVGRLYTQGYPVPWAELLDGNGHFVRLPTYPWQRERHWQESEASREYRLGAGQHRTLLGPERHPLLGRRLPTSRPTWEARLDLSSHRMLEDHQVRDQVVFPGAGYVEMALAAGRELMAQSSYTVEHLEFLKALALHADQTAELETLFDSDGRSFEIFSRAGGDAADEAGTWIAHARGQLSRAHCNEMLPALDLDEIRSRCRERLSNQDIYERFRQIGLQYGPLFSGLVEVSSGDSEALGEIRSTVEEQSTRDRFILHPALLDAAFQVLIAAARALDRTFLPVSIDRIRLLGPPEPRMFSHARIRSQRGELLLGQIDLVDERGSRLVEISGLRCRPLEKRAVEPGELPPVYAQRWMLKPLRDHAARLGPAILPTLDRVRRLLEPQATAGELAALRQKREAANQALDLLAHSYIDIALRELQWSEDLRLSGAALCAQLGVHPRFQRLLDPLVRSARAWNRVADDIDRLGSPAEIDRYWQLALKRHPSYLAELTLLRQLGASLSEILRGDVDPGELTGGEVSASLEHLHHSAPWMRTANEQLCRLLRLVTKEQPAQRPLRVLELGAGSGGTTSYLLPILNPYNTEYVFTDIAEEAVERARRRFGRYRFVQCVELDPNKGIDGQELAASGLVDSGFDIVLAGNLLQNQANPARTLARARQMIRPGGWLLLVRNRGRGAWHQLVLGLLSPHSLALEGLGADSEQAGAPASSVGALLEETGFAEVVYPTGGDGSECGLEQSQPCVLLARHQASDLDRLGSVAPVPRVAAAELGAEAPGSAQKGSDAPGPTLIFADRCGIGEKLAKQMEQRDTPVVLVHLGDSYRVLEERRFELSGENPEELRALLAVVSDEMGSIEKVVHLWSLDAAEGAEINADAVLRAQSIGCFSTLHLAQLLPEVFPDSPPALWLITRGVHAIGERTLEPATRGVHAIGERTLEPAIAQAPTWGLGRVVINEKRRLKPRLVDLGKGSDAEIDALLEEMTLDQGEDEVALRETERYVPRLVEAPPAKVDHEVPSVKLRARTLGLMESLSLVRVARKKPLPGEVEIRVRAASLNFKDVAKVMNLLSAETLENTYSERELGLDCAGTISALGEGITDFKIGDDVIAFAHGALGSYATASAHAVVRKPERISFEEAATLTTAFITAHYALCMQGGLKKGERVLIHSATGGVGLAAIQQARRVGAEIFATAGLPEKRSFLKGLGIEHVMDSRSLDFVSEVLEATGGEGVDLVLNSLAGEAQAQSISLLRPFGRLAEIGKREIEGNKGLKLRPFQENLTFFAVDMDRLMQQRGDLSAALMSQFGRELEEGTTTPLPFRAYPMADAESAFRLMMQAHHIGKIVLTNDDEALRAMGHLPDSVTFAGDGCYLITGGFGGFGLVLAEWLVEHGARHLALMGRSGPSSERARQVLRRLETAGAKVLSVTGDVSKDEDVADALSTIRNSGQHLRGIFHCAMVLDDGAIDQLTTERFHRVYAPKVLGAWHLHQMTLDQPLEHFVLFSSFAAMVGNPGQANYVAANAFLDALAHLRRARDLPALSVGWGAIGDAGFVAESPEVIETFAKSGVSLIKAREGLDQMAALLSIGATQVAVAPVEWNTWCRKHRMTSARYSHLVDRGVLTRPADNAEPLEKGEGGFPIHQAPEVRQAWLTEQMAEITARVFGISTSKLDTRKSLLSLGLDSLIAVELSHGYLERLQANLPAIKLLSGLSVAQLVVLADQQLTRGTSGESVSSPVEEKGNISLGKGLEPISLGKKDSLSLGEGSVSSPQKEGRSAVRWGEGEGGEVKIGPIATPSPPESPEDDEILEGEL